MSRITDEMIARACTVYEERDGEPLSPIGIRAALAVIEEELATPFALTREEELAYYGRQPLSATNRRIEVLKAALDRAAGRG
jgi:hypothetical protein